MRRRWSGSRAPGIRARRRSPLTAGVTDPDPLATDTVAWTLTQNGIVIADGHGPELHVPDPEPGRGAGRDGDRDRDQQRRRRGQRQRPDRAHRPVGRDGRDHRERRSRSRCGGIPVSTHRVGGGADRLIALVYGSNDLVDASTRFRIPVELDRLRRRRDASGRRGRRPARGRSGSQQPGWRRRRRHARLERR